MPRPVSTVKELNRTAKLQKLATSMGAVDLHFHGAFGIDLMAADSSRMNELSDLLWKQGVAAICPTTLSGPKNELIDATSRIGAWIRTGKFPGAIPLGIHLEGPFLNRNAAGAHPLDVIRKARIEELNELWNSSQGTLKLITLAPEVHGPDELKTICVWAAERKIKLSIGHTRCTKKEAREAFQIGFSSVTHAWNAMSVHHREPGVLGAAFGREKTYIELIIDGIHVDDSVIGWTLKNHKNTVFVSDAAPAACTDGKSWHSFGGIQCKMDRGASRIEGGGLAGGGILLPQAYANLIERQIRDSGGKIKAASLKKHLKNLNQIPLSALGLKESPDLKKRKVSWQISRDGNISCTPLSHGKRK